MHGASPATFLVWVFNNIKSHNPRLNPASEAKNAAERSWKRTLGVCAWSTCLEGSKQFVLHTFIVTLIAIHGPYVPRYPEIPNTKTLHTCMHGIPCSIQLFSNERALNHLQIKTATLPDLLLDKDCLGPSLGGIGIGLKGFGCKTRVKRLLLSWTHKSHFCSGAKPYHPTMWRLLPRNLGSWSSEPTSKNENLKLSRNP